MNFNFFFRILAAAVLLATGSILSVSAQKPGSPIPRQETLLNGLKLLIWNDPAAAKVTVRIRIHSGSAFDPQGKEGAMKLLSENLFPTEAGREFYSEDLGGGLEVVSNYDYIQINASATNAQLVTLLESLSSAVTDTNIDKETTAQLKTAMMARVASISNDPIYLADAAAAARLFGSFPYGRPQSGTVESLQKIDFADLKDLKQRFLTADNATVSVSGNIDGNLTYRALRRYFGSWLKSDKRIPFTFKQPVPAKNGLTLFDSPVANRSEFRFAVRGVARGDNDFHTASILALVLDRRFKQNEGGTAFVRHEPTVLPGSFVFGVSGWNIDGIRREDDKIALPVIDGYAKRTLDPPLRAEEFDAAKREYLARTSLISTADHWLDIDTYKLASAKADFDNAQAVSITDSQRVLERLRKEPVAYILVFADGQVRTPSSPKSK